MRTFDKRYRGDHPMFADPTRKCQVCGASYEEDEPEDEELKGYCSDRCKHKGRKQEE